MTDAASATSVAAATRASSAGGGGDAVLRLRDAGVSFGARTLWSGLDLDVRPGEFVAVISAPC